MRHAPVRAMDINQSKVLGNICVIMNLLDEGGVGDPDEGMEENGEYKRDIVDRHKYVILFHGNLSTFECVLRVLQWWALKETALRCYEFLIFIVGIFHLKMVCANALWHIFINPKTACIDVNSLFQFVVQYQLWETGKIGSDPGFCCKHKVIGYTGVALHLDAWWVEVKKRNHEWISLEALVQLEQTQEFIKDIADCLSLWIQSQYFQITWKSFCFLRCSAQEHSHYAAIFFALCGDLFSMNYRVIGHLETLFPPWIYIFRSTGKHRYFDGCTLSIHQRSQVSVPNTI